MRLLGRFSAAVFAFALGVGGALMPVSSFAEDAPDRAAIEEIVRDYLLKNPEVIRDALEELERRQVAETEARQREAIAERRDQLFRGDSIIVGGNPEGDVTLVEFFDYNCGFCERAHGDLVALLEQDPNLRVVYMEWPFLSPESVGAAKVSIAVSRQGRYEEFHTALLLDNGTATEARALEIAEAMGYDMARINEDKDSPQTLAVLEQNMLLADAIGVTGTPAYVIGDQLILGARGFAVLQEAIAETRSAGCKTC